MTQLSVGFEDEDMEDDNDVQFLHYDTIFGRQDYAENNNVLYYFLDTKVPFLDWETIHVMAFNCNEVCVFTRTYRMLSYSKWEFKEELLQFFENQMLKICEQNESPEALPNRRWSITIKSITNQPIEELTIETNRAIEEP
jgi:hypothetical protein